LRAAQDGISRKFGRKVSEEANAVTKAPTKLLIVRSASQAGGIAAIHPKSNTGNETR
jgi:hypothetical protein